MRVLLLIIFITAMCITSYAETKWVNGYVRQNGTYVVGHFKDTSGDGLEYNNVNYSKRNYNNVKQPALAF